MPYLLAKKEVFQWLKEGKKTVDIRKGKPKPGEVARFQCGPYSLDLRVVKTESGRLVDVLHGGNFGQVIPSAGGLDDAVAYLRRFYGSCDGVFTAYYLAPL